ncbi:MAG: restriction endonuclease, partial [Chloroflexi bacterium]|nr:restriction endonuclease [Chloroflexota bacterium]
DDIQAQRLAEEILANPPEIGYLTISNALQWRLQYSRVIEKAGEVAGVLRIS